MKNSIENTVGWRIRAVRQHYRLKQANFADSLQVRPSYISQIETGARTPSPMLLRTISITYNVCEEWLKSGKGSMFRADMKVAEMVVPYADSILKAIMRIVAQFPPEQQKEFLKYLEERKLLSELLAKRKDVNNAPV